MGPFLGVTFWQSPRHSAPQRKQLPTHPHSPQSALPKSFAVGGPEVGRQPVLWRAKDKAPPPPSRSGLRNLDRERESGGPVPSNSLQAIPRELLGPVRTKLLSQPTQVTQPLGYPLTCNEVQCQGQRYEARAGAPPWQSRQL